MWIASAVVIAVSLLLFGIGGAVYRGRVDLIHDYHQQKVREEDRPAYGRAIGRGLLCMAAGLLIGGLLLLLGDESWGWKAADGVGAAGILLSLILLVRAQKKYNRD